VLVLLFVLIVRSELPGLPLVIEMGFTLKLELVRRGKPLRLRLTLPVVKPPEGVTVMVSVPLEPGGAVRVVEAALSAKSGLAAAFTVRLTVVV
jgi:hypothetical protein